MNRSVTNLIRLVMDECLPPLVRDSKWFMWPFFYYSYRGKGVAEAMSFKANVGTWEAGRYRRFYHELDTVSRNRPTDLNRRCVSLIESRIDPAVSSILDVGCGSGFLADRLARPGRVVVGCDIVDKRRYHGFRFTAAELLALPFRSRQFDVVVCAHTLEHVLRVHEAVVELRRVCRAQLIVVVPCQREYFLTLDEHVNFFPYKQKLTALLGSCPDDCLKVGGDWLWIGRP